MANRFFVVGGVNTNWSTVGNWSLTSGGAGGQTVPGTADAVTFDASSGSACILDTATAKLALTFDTTNYTGSLTFNVGLTVAGSVTIGANTTFAGTGSITVNTTATLTSAVTVPQPLIITGSTTKTISGTWVNSGFVTVGNSTAAVVLNGGQLDCAGGFTHGGTSGTVSGTTLIRFTGTGTWTGASTSGALKNSLTIEAGAGTVTVSGNVKYNTGTLTYVSGTMVVSGSTLEMGLATTLNTAGITWNDVIVGAATSFTLTLSSALNLGGDLSLTNTTSTTFSGNFAINAATCTIAGGPTVTLANGQVITISGLTTNTVTNILTATGASVWNTGGLTTSASAPLTGTQTITFNGTGTWSTGAAAPVSNSIEINTAGTLTLSGTILYAASGTPTLTYTAGTVTQGTAILSIASSCTITNTNTGMTLHDLILTAAATLTLNTNPLVLDGALTLPNAAVTFAGTSGWTIGTLTNTTITATRITTFTAARTYTITGAFTTVHAAAQTVRFTFTAASTAYFVLGPGATQDIGFVDPTNLDASAGQKILSYHGVITTSPNWTNARTPNLHVSWPSHQVGM